MKIIMIAAEPIRVETFRRQTNLAISVAGLGYRSFS